LADLAKGHLILLIRVPVTATFFELNICGEKKN
jgi:hypothetical protein